MLSCGDTFLASDDDAEKLHLWIVVTPPSEGEVVTVCLVSARQRSERLVVMNSGDHPFVRHESVIAYSYSKIRATADIEAALATGAARKREPVSEAVLARIRAGLIDSDFTPNGVRHYYNSVMK